MKEIQPYVITISRILGSGGAYIGQQLAKKLDILYLDREIVRDAAKKLNLSVDDIEQYDEKPASMWQLLARSSIFSTPYVYVPPKLFMPSDKLLHDVEVEFIEETTKLHSAVIIGRGGSHIFRNHPRHVSVFLHCDLEFRMNRVQKLYGLDEKNALKMIHESDKKRGSFYKAFTGHEFLDARQYAICLDTSKIGIDKCFDMILEYVKEKLGLEK